MTAKATHDSQLATRPASPDAYKLELPADFQIPQGVEFSIDDKNPLWSQARAVMHDIDQGRLSGQQAFSKLMALYAGAQITDRQGFDTWRAKEVEKLGPTGQARVTAVQTWMKGLLGDKPAAAMNAMLVTSDIVQAFEGLMARFASQGGGSFSQTGRVPADEAGKIPGYENMSFMQRRQAQDLARAKAGNR